MKLQEDTLSAIFRSSDPGDNPEENPRSEPVSDNSAFDPPGYRGEGGETDEEILTGKPVNKKDRDKIASMIENALNTGGMLLSLRCEECGQTLGESAEDMAGALATYIGAKPRMAAKFLEGGGDTLDLLMVVAAVTPVLAKIAHHHIPFLADQEIVLERVDPLQPDTPWQQ